MKTFTPASWIAVALSIATLESATGQAFVDFREAVRVAEPALTTVIVDPNVADAEDRPADEQAGANEPDNRKAGGPRIEWFGIDGQPIGEIPGMGRRGMLQSARGETIGSAVAVGETLLIAHVGSPVKTVTVEDVGGNQVEGEVRAFDYVTGLAAIEVPKASYPPLLVTAAETEPGLPVIAAWIEEGILVTDAGMIATRPIAADPSVGATPRIDFGGGNQFTAAAVLDASGMLVGVLIPNQTGRQVCAPAAIVRRLMEAASKEQPDDLKRGLVGIQFQGGGPLVAEVSPDSAAEKAGIRAGDLVTQVGALPVSSSADVVAAVAGARAGDTLDITVKRGEKTMTIPVTLTEHPQQLLAGGPAGGPGFAMRQAFEWKDGQRVPMEIQPDGFPGDGGLFPRDLLRQWGRQGLPIWPGPAEGQPDGFGIEGGDVQETLKELQKQMEQLNQKLDQRN